MIVQIVFLKKKGVRSSLSNQHTPGGVSTLRTPHFLFFAQQSNKTKLNFFCSPT